MCDRKLGLMLVHTEAAWAGVTNTMAFLWAPTRDPQAWFLGLPAPPVTPRPPGCKGRSPLTLAGHCGRVGPELFPGTEKGRSRARQGAEPGPESRPREEGSGWQGCRRRPPCPLLSAPGGSTSAPLRPGEAELARGWPGRPPSEPPVSREEACRV